MIDFREWKEEIKEAVKAINEKTSWKWTATINKKNVKLTNGYIKGEYEKDFFEIESEGHDLYLYGPCDEFDGRVVDEGDFEKRLADIIDEANYIFNTTY